jgi:hypothetical protein
MALLLGDKEAAIEQAVAAGRPEDAAALCGGAGKGAKRNTNLMVV